VCRNILLNTAVFKNDEVGKKGFIDFLASVEIK
jgi:galactose-1-phosphate uridylyltransferase